MGNVHMHYFSKLDNTKFTAVADVNRNAADKAASDYGVTAYYNPNDLLSSADVDAVLIATPHYFHTPCVIMAFEKGKHVLTEKPVAVHARDAARMNNAHAKYPDLIYAAMFQKRTDGIYKKVKEIFDSNVLGKIIRVNYITTTWFRSQAYYNSSSWRATWKGEGGGVLLNQCPHDLDILQWITGMPKRVYAHAYLGKWHDVEVEDDLTAFFEYGNGATGVFLTNTIECPGVNRLEICGEYGQLIMEDKAIKLRKSETSILEYSKTTKKPMKKLDYEEVDIDIPNCESGHKVLTQNFINAILYGKELIAHGEEGYNSIALANAMLMSGITKKPVDLPLDENGYVQLLEKLIKKTKTVAS